MNMPLHPGKILLTEFLVPLRITTQELALSLNVPHRYVLELIECTRNIDAAWAWLLADALNTSPKFWMDLQSVHDLSLVRPGKHHG